MSHLGIYVSQLDKRV